MKHGQLLSAAKDPEAESVYEMYYEFSESLSKLAGHRILAIIRGEKEKFLTVKIDAPVGKFFPISTVNSSPHLLLPQQLYCMKLQRMLTTA